MRYAVTVAALALTVAVSACATGASQQEFTRADADAIRQNAADLTAAFNAKEVDKLVTLYADNSVFMPPNAPLIRGREPLQSFYSSMIERGASNLELKPEEVNGHGPLAYESGTYSVTYEKGGRDRGKYVRILRNTAGKWRTEKTIWSSDFAPVPPSAE
jgi:ketosteroid isomerase-like protein